MHKEDTEFMRELNERAGEFKLVFVQFNELEEIVKRQIEEHKDDAHLMNELENIYEGVRIIRETIRLCDKWVQNYCVVKEGK